MSTFFSESSSGVKANLQTMQAFSQTTVLFHGCIPFSRPQKIFPQRLHSIKPALLTNSPKTQKPADAIIAARYEVVTKDYFVYQNLNTKVTGYPAVMEGLDEVKVISFYIDGKGNMHVLSGNDVYVNIAPVVKVGWF